MENENIFIILLDLFNPTLIFAQLDYVVSLYWTTLVPGIMILSIATRYLELQVENLGEGAKWSDAIKDVKAAIIFTGLYAGFGALVIKFHVALCSMMYEHGSLRELLDGYQEFINEIESASEEKGWLDKVGETVSKYNVDAILMRTIHFLSYLLLVTVNALLRIVYALAFCLLYVWGMFAVPTMATKLLNVASGWFRAVVALFLWPIIESIIYTLINPMFVGLGERITASQTQSIGTKLANLSLVYSFANILLMAVGIAAFIVAVVISMNQNLLGGLGTSLMAAFAAGTSMVMNGAKVIQGASRTTRGLAGAFTGSPAPPDTGGGDGGPAPSGSLDGMGSGPGVNDLHNSAASTSAAPGANPQTSTIQSNVDSGGPQGTQTTAADAGGNTGNSSGSTISQGDTVKDTGETINDMGVKIPTEQPAQDVKGTNEPKTSAVVNSPGINELKST